MKTLPKHDSKELPADFATLCAADVMQRDLITVHASDPVGEVARVLADARISGVPVLDDNEEVIGILSMADLVDRYAEDDDALPEEVDYRDEEVDEGDEEETEVVAFHRSSEDEVCAGDLMTTEITFIAPTASLREASRIMVKKHIHRLLVVDRGRAVGIVTTLDILRAVAG